MVKKVMRQNNYKNIIEKRHKSSIARQFMLWCKDKIIKNIAYIFLAELYFMLLAQTIDG